MDVTDPPEGWVVEPAEPDGWRITIPVRGQRALAPRLAVGASLLLATVLMGFVEPIATILPGFAFLAFLFVVLFEETGPGKEAIAELTIGSRGVRVGDLQIPAGEIRDVYWEPTQPGEMVLGVRNANGATEVLRVPTSPEFQQGLSTEQRDWLAGVVRAVGRANRSRSGSEKDVPAALKQRLASREP